MAALNLTKPVGKGGNPVEERQVQDLLRKCGIVSRARTLAGDIEEFQRLCGLTKDGTISPRGPTLRHLNAVVNPLKLTIADNVLIGEGAGASTVSSQRIVDGGYTIRYKSDDGAAGDTKVPSSFRVLLGPDRATAFDVSDRPMKDLMNAETLVELLTLIDTRSAWSTVLSMKLFVTYGNTLLSTSNAASLQCPIKPHNGRMLSSDENKDLVYLGDPDTKKFYGRMFKTLPGFDKHLFSWAGRFELDSTKRGFDCITYAGTTCAANSTDMGGTGEDLATALEAKEVVHEKKSLEKATMQQIKKLFAADAKGHYLLYSTGHVTLVVDGVVYEFKPKQSGNKGFVKTAVKDWVTTHHDGWTLRKLPSKPPLANS
jgi:hypothetical protein